MQFNIDYTNLMANIFSFLTAKEDLITVSYLNKLCRAIVTSNEFSILFRNAHQQIHTMQIDNLSITSSKRKRTEATNQHDVKYIKTEENTPLDKTINALSSTINQNADTFQIREKIPQNGNNEDGASLNPLGNQANMQQPLFPTTLPLRIAPFKVGNPTPIPFGSSVQDNINMAIWMHNPSTLTIKIVTQITGPNGIIPNGMAKSLVLNPNEAREERRFVAQKGDSPLSLDVQAEFLSLDVLAEPFSPDFPKRFRSTFSLNVFQNHPTETMENSQKKPKN